MIVRKGRAPADPEAEARAGHYGASERVRYSDAGGLTQFGAHVETLEPGSRSSNRHWHEEVDEFLCLGRGDRVAFSGHVGDEPLFCRVDRRANLKGGGLSGWGINELVQRRVANAGLDASRFSGHSLRAGLPTSASAQKVGMEAWMPHTRHKSVAVAMRYARRGTLFTNNPAARVGL